jgi:hypothetical protein
MSIAARHLETRRPRKDRDVTWSRRVCCDEHGVTWSFWRRDCRRVIHLRTVNLRECGGEFGPRTLRQAWRELRDLVDEIDLALMEKIA